MAAAIGPFYGYVNAQTPARQVPRNSRGLGKLRGEHKKAACCRDSVREGPKQAHIRGVGIAEVICAHNPEDLFRSLLAL